MVAIPGQPAGESERLLVSYLRSLETNPLGWQAAHVKLSALNAGHRRQYISRIAVNNLIHLVRKYQGRLFVLHNYDVMLVCKSAPVAEVEEAIYRLKYLLQDDPVVTRNEDFSAWYDLSVRLPELLEVAYQLLKDKVRADEEAAARALGGGAIEPLDPERLYRLQTALSSIDIGSYLRRQAVCAIVGDEPPAPVFEEVFVRIAELQRPLMPNVNLTGNRWLFQHLTQSLDFRVLTLLARHAEEYVSGPISLNLNVDMALSEPFLAFDAAVRRNYAGAIVIELQTWDIFADIRAFNLTRDFLRGRGYRLCLDGLAPEAFVLFDRKALGVDLMKLVWDDTVSGRSGAKTERLAEAVHAAGAQRVILSRCDTEAAIAFGKSLGITMFQGHHVDQILNPVNWRPH